MDNTGRIKRLAALQQIFSARAKNLAKSGEKLSVDQVILNQLEQNSGSNSDQENSAKERDPHLPLG